MHLLYFHLLILLLAYTVGSDVERSFDEFKKSDDYDIITDQENIIAKIAEHKEEVIEPTPAAETIEGESETTTEESLDEQNKDNQTAEPKEEPVDENKE